jgi:hypothetical protein
MESFKIGDEVVVSGNSSYQDWITTVSHVTPTGRVKVTGLVGVYFSHDGHELNPHPFSGKHIKLATPEDKIEFLRRKIIYRLKETVWEEFDYSSLRKAYSYIQELKQKKNEDK